MSAFSRGHTLMMTRLSSYFSLGGEFAEQSGMSYYYFLSDLAKNFDKNAEALEENWQTFPVEFSQGPTFSMKP